VTPSGPDELAPLDALMLKTDADPALRTVVTGVLVLDDTPEWERLVSVFEAATVKAPRLRQKILAPLLPVGPAEWVPDARFELGYHLRRAAAPGDGNLPDVLDAISATATAPFDRARPLWEATIFEGMRHGAVLVMRAHHALTDGVGAIEILAALLDPQPDSPADPPAGAERSVPGPAEAGQSVPGPAEARQSVPGRAEAGQTDPEPAEAGQSVPDPTPAGLLLARLAGMPQQLAGSLLQQRNLSLAVVAGRLVLLPGESLARLTTWTSSLRRLMTAEGAVPSALLRARSRARRFAALDLPLAALKEAARAAGCTVNDAYLAGLLGGFRRYQEKHGMEAADVPMALPINVRESVAGDGANQFSAAVLAGPATIEDPVDRMRHVAGLVRQARAEPGLDAAQRLGPVLAQLPSVFATLGMAAHARRIDLQASNVMGAPMATYLAGQRVRRLYPFGPLPGIPVMVVLMSHDGTCCIGVNLDPAAIDDLPLFMSCLCEGFDEILGDRGSAVPAAVPA
jgi:diacylglycerol O-acyltransferase